MARDLGAVVCPPLGHEMMVSHRAHRHLAESLAAAGVATVRVDYDGTGDSAGDDHDPDRVSAWLASVTLAVRTLRERSGAGRVALVGTRAGALLALAFAAREHVDALVLSAPPASGRALLRELRAFQSMKPQPARPRTEPVVGGEEMLGFFFGKETVEALTALDGAAILPRAPVDVFVVARGTPPGNEEKVVKRLREAGCRVDSGASTVGSMLTDDPYSAVVPDAAWREVSGWLRERSSAVSTAPSARADTAVTTALVGDGVRESLVRFGSGTFGVLTEPTTESRARPVVVLHNIGANHRVGSNRLYVTWARAFAAEGLSTLRFDRPGLGDSPAIGEVENYVYSARSAAWSREAMDFLVRSARADRFVLMGLCSGAYVSYHSALADGRVVGAVLVNPLTFRWREGDSLEVVTRKSFSSTRFYLRALTDPATFARLRRGEVRVGAIAVELARRGAVLARRALAPTGEVLLGFRALAARGAETLLVLGTEDGSVDVVEAQLGAGASAMRKQRRFRLVMVDGTDHTFTPLGAQAELLRVLLGYLRTRVP